MAIDLKKWATLGVSTALLGASLTACSASDSSDAPKSEATAETGEQGEGEASEAGAGEGGEAGEVASTGEAGDSGEGEGGEGEGEGGEAGAAIETLPLPNRLAFMTGHVKAGLAVYRAGDPDAAAPHLLHPVSETHEGERAGLDALGFDSSLFEAVSKALEEGRPASEIEPQLAAAETNLLAVAEAAGGDQIEIIQYLMDVIVEEYTIAITDGAVSDPGEYQDAWGFAVVARERAVALGGDNAALLAEIDDLIALWPEAPIPPSDPTPVAQVIAQTSRVALALP